LLSSLFDEVQTVLEGDADPSDELMQRLYPAAYRDDAAAEREYRSLTEASLRTLRSERIDSCRAELAAGDDVDLGEPDVAERWLQVLNDLRLTLGTRLGVTEDDHPELDPGDPEAQPRLVYMWLTAVQDSLVSGLLR
jgi:hypothetical protein